MGQYRTGTVSVTAGSAVVSGNGTTWLTNVEVGDSFKVSEIDAIMDVQSVDSDTQITLTTPWSGSTLADQGYQICRDFTPNLSLPEIWAGDRDWPFHLTQALRKIDDILNQIFWQEAIRTYDDSALSGTPIIIKFAFLGYHYYTKCYPTIAAEAGESSDDVQTDLYTIEDTSLSGSPVILKFLSNGVEYFFKAYPTVAASVFYAGDQIIHLPRYPDDSLSGTARVAKADIDGTDYYFKLYPTRG
jgi:hypothetical protein